MTISRRFSVLLLGLLLAAPGFAQPIKTFDSQSLDQIVASHRGKPFLLLVWSMDCEFCQASLEVLSKARAANPDLKIVTVTTDPAADRLLTTQVQSRLSSLSLTDDTWSFGGDSPERLRYMIDPSWHGEKPRSYWYDATGKRTAFSGMIRPEKLTQWQHASNR